MATEKTSFSRKLFNKGIRRIDHKRGSLEPQTAGAFTPDEANYMLKLYKHELIDMDHVTVDSLVNVDAAAAQKKLAEQQRAHEGEIATRLRDARHLKSVEAYREARAEGFSHSEAAEIAGLPTDFPEPADLSGTGSKAKGKRGAAAPADGGETGETGEE